MGKISSRGRLARRDVIDQPSCARPIDAEEDHVPPSLLTVSTQHVPPQSHRARSGCQPTPEAPAGFPGAESGRAEGAKGPNPPGPFLAEIISCEDACSNGCCIEHTRSDPSLFD